MRPNDSAVGKEKKITHVDPESVESDPRLRLEENQNFDDHNRVFDETSLRTETTNSEKYARTKVCDVGIVSIDFALDAF